MTGSLIERVSPGAAIPCGVIVPRTPSDPAAVAAHYDRLDAFYRELWGEHVHHGLWTTGRETPEAAAEALAARVVEAVGEAREVVDVGCGYGATSRRIAEATGAAVTALTLSEAQAAYARRQPVARGSVRVLVQDWLQNDLPKASADAVVAVESTTHMPERERVFREMARVLRPGGRLVLCVWATSEQPRAWEIRHLLEPICREGRLAGMGSLQENRAWLASAGLAAETDEDWSREVARTWTVVARRVVARLATDRATRQFVRDASEADRVFALTVARLRLAFATGAMRYGFLVARKP
ncbi:MAG TPA: methyltransferase domain-containing protein [Bacteroidetes bacterium]|nr:methyltransferase domain-containing protein [Bacteroidota bacterium]HIL57845.1 methyltransferase domain-containing protein [Rhodothermales bacterium]